MRFENSVQRLLVGLIVAFGAVMAAAAYWTITGPETLLQEPINYRLRDAAASLIRGAIVDRNGVVLVESRVGEDGFVTRRARDPSLFSLTGYMSRRYGVGGAEAAYDDLLRGASLVSGLTEAVMHDLLHLPRRGIDIRLTIDLDVQQAAAAALQSAGKPGAAVVMDAASGELLAVVSSPSVDPAILDANWTQLVADPDKPFLNRATQGQYAPGTALSTVILTAWLIDGRTVVDELTPSASFAPCSELRPYTVQMAFIEACEPALLEMALLLGKEKFDAAAALFQLREPVQLAGFTLPPAERSPLIQPEATESPDQPMIERLGLDSIRLSPLNLAVVVAAVVNGGNSPQPFLLDAQRAPDAQDWAPVLRSGTTFAVTTAQTALTAANVLRKASASGIAHAEVCAGTDLGAAIGVSHSDEQSFLFFTGFAVLADGHAVVAVIVQEGFDLTSAGAIASAGNAVLCAALAAFAEG